MQTQDSAIKMRAPATAPQVGPSPRYLYKLFAVWMTPTGAIPLTQEIRANNVKQANAAALSAMQKFRAGKMPNSYKLVFVK